MRSNKKRYESPQATFRQFPDDREIIRTSGGYTKAALSWDDDWGSDWSATRDTTVIGSEN